MQHTKFRYILSFVFSLATASSNYAQDSLSALAFLEEKLTQIDQKFNSFLPDNDFQPAWIQKTEIRTETDNFQLQEQQYQVRLSPSTPKIRKAEKRLQQLYREEALEDVLERKERFVLGAYENVLRAYALAQLLALEEKLLNISKKEVQISEQLILVNQLQAEDWLQVQTQLLEVEQRVAAYKIEYNLITENKALLWDNFMTIEQIVEAVEKLLPTDLIIEDIQTKINLIEGEMDLEAAKQKKYLDFIQLEYNSNPQDIFREKAAISAAFLLPFKGSRKLKMEELAIEKMGIAAEADLQNQWQVAQVLQLKNDILMLHQQLLVSKKRTADFQARTDLLLQRLQKSEQADPLLLLSAQRQAIEANINHLKLENKIRELYLELLEEANLLSR
ncbi:MAG: hypothetical protein AAF849_01230 [Bacteroidota bacterium]